ncbi:MAG: hydrogenase iron-sulfur subunit [Hyphomicrobiales bacterium]|nr:hydrogenase iron-sulfur subunit [Hyphomicrobiales bacterium]
MTVTEKKPGVYLCSGCGIGDAVSVDELETVATGERRVPLCRRHEALCSDEGVAMIKADVDGGEVNQAIIAACSPRVMTEQFDFSGALTVRANLREQVVWSQPAGDENTQMLAADNLRMAIGQAMKSTPPEPAADAEISETILVVGGGVAGLNAALEGARAGHDVILAERSDQLGGWARKWSKRVPHRPPYREPQDNDVTDLIAAIEGNGKIKVMTNTKVAKTGGMPGRFAVTLNQGGSEVAETIGAIVVATGWRPYDPANLGHLGYGASPDVVTAIDVEGMLANGGLKRKSNGEAAKMVAFVQCAGSRDPDHLPYCSSVCCSVSIKQALQVVENDPDAMCYIIYEELRTPGTAEEFYRRAQEAGVVFVKGKVKSVGGDLTVTYDDDLLGNDIPLQGLDMVVLATGMVPNSTDPDAEVVDEEKSADQLTDDIDPQAQIAVAGYTGEEPAAREKPERPLPPGGPILNLQYRQGPHIPILADGFSDSHYICFPYETRRTGIYTCGPVRRPMDMAETAEDAAGAVLKAIQAIKGAGAGSAMHPRVGDLSYPKFGLDICTKCRRCTVECPFGAIDEDEKDYPILNPSRCRRCGTCMGACPVRTITFDNYSPQMVSEMIGSVEIPDEFSEKPRILILACENDAYPAIDMAGINRHQLSPFVRIIPVRCLGSVTLLWISTALEKGYDGVMLMGCKSGDDYQCHYVKGSAIAKERMSKVGETLKSLMLEEERVRMAEISIADSANIPKVINGFADEITAIGFNPFKGF